MNNGHETGKTLVACFFGWFGYSCWEAGKLAAVEILFDDIYKIMLFGVLTGIFGMLALIVLVDISTVLIRVIMRKPLYDNKTLVGRI